MSTALALIETSQYELMAKLAKVAAGSGYSKVTEIQAMFIMLKGFELGISPMQALDGIQIIQSKPTVSPQLMLALINRSGELQDIQMDGDAKAYTVTMTRKGRSPHTEVFTIENAKAMGLAGKDNWQKQPAVMLKWRAVSACARVVFPDVIQGMYTPEEMGADVSEDASGELIIEQPPLAVLPPPTVDTSTGEIVEGKVVEDAPPTNVEGSPSDLPAETDTTPIEAQNSAETAKSRFAGNGAPASGEKKRIGNDPAPSYTTNMGAVKTAVRSLYDNAKHMENSIAMMEREGKLTPDMSVELAIRVITNHKDESEAPF